MGQEQIAPMVKSEQKKPKHVAIDILLPKD
jgi:hypothetical protein